MARTEPNMLAEAIRDTLIAAREAAGLRPAAIFHAGEQNGDRIERNEISRYEDRGKSVLEPRPALLRAYATALARTVDELIEEAKNLYLSRLGLRPRPSRRGA